MKKPSNKKGVTAAKIIAGVAATIALGCNINGCVYGPAPIETTDYDPTTNENRTVYGPPAGETSETAETDVTGGTDVTEPEPTFAPGYNENEDVYGPPEWFE